MVWKYETLQPAELDPSPCQLGLVAASVETFNPFWTGLSLSFRVSQNNLSRDDLEGIFCYDKKKEETRYDKTSDR